MLRQALPLTRQAVFRPIGPKARSQWQATRPTRKVIQRAFADQKLADNNTKPSIHDSNTIVLPGTASQTAANPQPAPPGAVPSASPTAHPEKPVQETTVPLQDVPRMPPPPGETGTPAKGGTSGVPTGPVSSSMSSGVGLGGKGGEGTSSPPPQLPPSPPSQVKRRRSRLWRLLQVLVVLGALGFGGGTYYSLVSDNFHDFFTEYIPFGEDTVLYLEEREFRRRFPRITSPTNRPLPDTGSKITIPSKSGVTWKIAEEEKQGSDLQTKGRHMSALDANKKDEGKAEHAQQTPTGATGVEKIKAVEQAKQDSTTTPSKPTVGEEKSKADAAPASTSSEKEKKKKEKTERKQRKAIAKLTQPKETAEQVAARPPEVDEPSRFVPMQPIDPLTIKNADEPLVQDLVKIMNDIITVVNDDGASHKYNSSIAKAKSALANAGARIMSLKQAEKKAADEKIKSTQIEFDNAARELVRRLEIEMRDQEGRWKDEFETERENIVQLYQSRLQSETDRAAQLSEQHLRNELLEQAITLKKQFLSEVPSLVESERSGRLAKLSELSSSVSELEKLTADWNSVIDSNLKTQHLQVAVEAVRSSLENADRPRPFINELAALKEIAADDALISAAIASINPTAYQRGVPTTAQLIDRFRRVAAEVRKAALLPEDAGVASHAASWAMSKLLFKKQGMTVGDDVESVLTRAETLLEEGRLDEACREVNTLQGWAKKLSADWLGECRRVLEVRQAVDVMATEARLEGLMVD